MTITTGWTALDVCGCCDTTGGTPAGVAQGVPLLRCTVCGTLRFSAIAPPETIYRDGYHTGDIGYGWDYAAQADGYEEVIAGDRLAWIERFVGGGRLVDVGGGLGFFASVAARRGWRAEVLEPVPSACEFARTRLGVEATEGGAEVLADRAGAYDVVCFNHCIEHISPSREIIASSAEALTPNGLLFVEVPNHGSMARRWQGEHWLGWQAGEHVYVFTRETLLRLLDAAGLEPVAVRTYVPGWDGLLPDGWAHMLGLAPLLQRSVALKRKVLGRSGREVAADGGSVQPLAIRERDGASRAIYTRGFRLLARAEEALGVGTNIQVLARPKP